LPTVQTVPPSQLSHTRNAVELDQVSKSFGSVRAVDDLSLRVPAGSIYGFIGPNGSGKTTTLRMILNIFKPDSGALRILGGTLNGSRDPRIGYLPEERGLYRRMKVRELLLFMGELKTGRSLRAEVDGWLQRLELAAWGDRKVEALSKGMAQKVQFIAAALGPPQLLVLDEPFSGLDPVNLEALRQAVLAERARGATVIFSTHDMAMAEQLCDFIFMIFRGRKVLDGTLADIQERFGMDRVRVRTAGGAAAVRDLPGVAQVEDAGRCQELQLEPGADPQHVLAALLTRTIVQHFEIARPSLHDIFVRIARPPAEGGGHG
jgi:ABC-2 type transport system ATP-binding protein